MQCDDRSMRDDERGRQAGGLASHGRKEEEPAAAEM